MSSFDFVLILFGSFVQIRSTDVQKFLIGFPGQTCSRLRVRLLAGLILACLSLSAASSPIQADTRIEIQNLSVGIDGQFRVGCWAAIEFDVVVPAGTTQTLTSQIRVSDPDGHGVLSHLSDISGSGTWHVQGLFRSGKLYAPLSLEILEDEKLILQQTIHVDRGNGIRALKQNAHFWILDGEQPAFETAAAMMKTLQSGSIQTAPFENFSKGVFDARALEAVNLIVLNADSQMEESTSLAIRDWVYRGGRLIVCVGADREQLSSGELASWLPVFPKDEIPLKNLGGFNQWVPGSNPMRMLDTLPCAVFSMTAGEVLASDFGNALAIRSACGIGSVTMLGVRLDQRPFENWSSRADMAMVLGDFEPPWTVKTASTTSTVNSGLSPTGVSDFQTQLIHALDHYDEIQRPSHWVVIAWGSLLILIIGPIDYFLLHRVVKHPQLTWITLPIWLTCLTLWSYRMADSMNNVDQMARQIEVLDVDLTTGSARGRAWMNCYSPETRRYKIEAHVDSKSGLFENSQVQFLKTSWIERPETSYRGMYRTGGLESQKPSYQLSADDRRIENLPIRIWSTGSVGTEWEKEIDPEKFAQTQLLDPGNGRLTGMLTYKGSEPLTEWFIAYGNFAYFPKSENGELPPPLRSGDRFEMQNARSNMLKGVLTGLTHTSIFHDELKNRQTSLVNRELYNTLSRDPIPILRTLSFHESAGGRSYTELSNDSLNTVDLSNSLHLHRAVLFGKIKNPATQFSLNDNPLNYEQQDSVIRIIMPVEFELADLNAPPDPTLLKIK